MRWTVTTPAGWWFLAARLGALATAARVESQYGETPAIFTLVVAIIAAGLIAPPAPDTVDDERGPHAAAMPTP